MIFSFAHRANSIDLFGAGFVQFLAGQTKRATRVRHIVHKNGHTVGHMTHKKHHGLDFVGAHSLLVDDGEVDAEAIRYRRDTLGATGVRRYDNRLALPFRYVVHDPFDDGGLGAQVVHGHVEEALDLRRVQVHGDDVVRARHTQHVGHEFSGDGRAMLFLFFVYNNIEFNRNMTEY